jgi:hypothetical protein
MSLPGNAGKQFIVPSLLQEGGVGAANPDLIGTDLVIEDDYFFQFKMGDRLTTQGASEIGRALLPPTFLPYFRFNVKNSPNSHQFNALVALSEVKGANKVFYISPLFHYPRNNGNDDEFAFQDFWQSIPINSMSKVTWIDFHQWAHNNPLPGELNDNHVICCNLDSVAAGYGYLFSEPKEIKISKYNSDILTPNSPEPKHFYIDEIIAILDENSKEGFFWRRGVEKILKNPILSLKSIITLQNFLLIEFNIFWLPAIKKS